MDRLAQRVLCAGGQRTGGPRLRPVKGQTETLANGVVCRAARRAAAFMAARQAGKGRLGRDSPLRVNSTESLWEARECVIPSGAVHASEWHAVRSGVEGAGCMRNAVHAAWSLGFAASEMPAQRTPAPLGMTHRAVRAALSGMVPRPRRATGRSHHNTREARRASRNDIIVTGRPALQWRRNYPISRHLVIQWVQSCE